MPVPLNKGTRMSLMGAIGLTGFQAARTVEELHQAIGEAFQSIQLSDIAGWFEHCGYCIQSV